MSVNSPVDLFGSRWYIILCFSFFFSFLFFSFFFFHKSSLGLFVVFNIWFDLLVEFSQTFFSDNNKRFIFFELNLLGRDWFTTSYRFQVYNETRQNIIHRLYCVPIAPSKVSFCPHLFPLCPLPVSPHPFSLWLLPLLSLSLYYICVWLSCLILSPSFIQPFSPLPLTGVSLFHVSMPLFLFCQFLLFNIFHM